MTERAFVDACVILEGFLGEASTNPERLGPSQWVMKAAAAGDLDVFVSPLVAAETMGHGGIRSPPGAAGRGAQVRQYFESTAVRLVEIDRLMMLRAMDTAASLGLRGADALHVACALRAECDVLYTYDTVLLALDGQAGRLRFLAPVIKGQTDLPFGVVDGPTGDTP